jgi:hypothetical protein
MNLVIWFLGSILGDLLSWTSLQQNIRSTVTRLTEAGAILHREFPFWGNFQSPLVAKLSCQGTEQTAAAVKYYQQRLEDAGTPEACTELELRLAAKLDGGSDRDKFSVLGDAVRRELAQSRKVVVFSDEHPRWTAELDPDFGLPFQQHLQSLGIDSAVIRVPEGPSRPLLPRERNPAREKPIEASNQREMDRFVDGSLYNFQTRTFARSEDDSGQGSTARARPVCCDCLIRKHLADGNQSAVRKCSPRDSTASAGSRCD